MNTRIFIAAIMMMTATAGYTREINDSINVRDTIPSRDMVHKNHKLKEVTVVSRQIGMKRMNGAINGITMEKEELFKAACCNLGESFVTNPSVDVTYSDATTGAKQIKLLGLSGTYVQMLTENIPNFRGAASPFALDYVPGPWMQSIQVSKGSSTVKNGYESITGQINVEYRKPNDEEQAEVNLYGDTKSRYEANADANIHLGKGLSTEILTHYEDNWGSMDDNKDGFLDKPNRRQYNLQNRWAYSDGQYIFHGGISAMKEKRIGGQTDDAPHVLGNELYKIGINTDRYEAYLKNAFVLNQEHKTNIALMLSGSLHNQNSNYGHKIYNVDEKNFYGSLMFESDITRHHNISTGLSVNHDYYDQDFRLTNEITDALNNNKEKETVTGAYVQYTFNLDNKFVAMAGLRADHSTLYGTFVTPRLHLKYVPNDIVSFRLSAGKGYRSVHALAENNFLLASGRALVIDNLRQESAWNYGASAAFNIPLFGKTLRLNTEYYYTRFEDEAVIDYDSDPTVIHISNLNGKSYSHTMQIDATYPMFMGMTVTAAYRLNDVKSTYGGKLMERSLTSKYKGLISASYKTPLGIWQFDATLQLNGGGRMPEPYTKGDGTLSWNRRFSPYQQLSAQVTRWFRKFSIYAGGENLTNFTQANPILGASNPWSNNFDPTMIWGPVHGRMFYAGIRFNLNNN
jgi:outer membrane receptor for ferrienterochelin and colicin